MSRPLASILSQILQDTPSFWSPQFPVNRSQRVQRGFDPLPRTSGIYRLHLDGIPVLAYVGQSKDIRRRVNELRGVEGDRMPFTDPHIAGPALFAWRQIAPERTLTVSFAAVDCSAYWRQGLEDLVISLERWKRKQRPLAEPWMRAYSPLTNFHRMPPGWESSTSRARGIRGGPNPSQCDEPSIMPVGELDDPRAPTDEQWGNHAWSPWQAVGTARTQTNAHGLYRLRRADAETLFFIGHGLIADAAKGMAASLRDLQISYVTGPWSQREQLELLTDLLGLYLCKTQRLPDVQYGGKAHEHAGSAWPLDRLPSQVAQFVKLWLPDWGQSLVSVPERVLAVG